MTRAEQIAKMVEEWPKSFHPVTGKIIVVLDNVANTFVTASGLTVVDESSKKAKVRKATVVAISSLGAIEVGHWTRSHDVKPGDRVLIDMKAARAVPGFKRTFTLWEQYVFGFLENEPEPGGIRLPGDIV